MKQFEIPIGAKVWVYSEPVNMCCSFNGLAALAKKQMRKFDESGDLFMFLSRKRNYVKILYWHEGGWCIFAKRLVDGEFGELRKRSLTPQEMGGFLSRVMELAQAA